MAILAIIIVKISSLAQLGRSWWVSQSDPEPMYCQPGEPGRVWPRAPGSHLSHQGPAPPHTRVMCHVSCKQYYNIQL